MLSAEQTKAIIKFAMEDNTLLGKLKEVLSPSSACSGAYAEILNVMYMNYSKSNKTSLRPSIKFMIENSRNNMDTSQSALAAEVIPWEKIDMALEEIDKSNVDPKIFYENIVNVLKAEVLKTQIRRLTAAGEVTPKDVSEVARSLEKVMKFDGSIRELSPAYKRIDDVLKPESRIVCSKTPWPTINDCIKGGLGRGEYGVILAYSNVGKSTLLCALGYHALTLGKNVLHITAEDSERETLVKYVSLHTKEDRDAIDRGHAPQALHKFKTDSTNGKLGTLYTYETLEYHTKPSQIEYILRDYEAKFTTKIDVLVVDYAQILKPESTSSDDESQGDWKQIEDIHRTLRKIGRVCDVATWSAHQAKETDKRERILKLQHMGKAKACGQVPEVMLSLNEGEGEGEEALSNQILYVARNRLGAKNIQVELKVNHRCISYVEV